MSWLAGFEAICRADAPLHEHTWYRLGGPARWLLSPRDEVELAAVMARVRDAGIAWKVLGRGANLLVRDEGFDGAVIRLNQPAFERIAYTDNIVSVGAGADFPKLIRDTIQRGAVGLEVLAGIPGSFGGILRMNAGGRYGEIRTFVKDVRVLDRDGALVTRTPEQVGFSYRHTELSGCIVLGARLELQPGDSVKALKRHKEIWNEKYDQQPPVSARSAGCIFKNPPGNSAGKLLDEAGLKGARVGGAEISPRHANFIVADASAGAADVLDLIRLARDRVWNQTGIELQLEIEIW